MITNALRQSLEKTNSIVVLVSDELPPDTGFGGIGSYTWNLSQGLRSLDCPVFVISKSKTKSTVTIDSSGVVIRYAYSSLWQKIVFKLLALVGIDKFMRAIFFSWNVYWQIRQLKKYTRVLAIEGPEWNGQLFFVAWLSRWKYIIRLHTHLAKIMELEKMPKNLDSSCLLKIESYAVSRATVIFYASDLSLQEAKKDLPIQRQQLVKIPLLIDLQKFTSGHRLLEPTVVFVGRLEVKKGIYDLFEAMPRIKKLVPEVRFWVIGPDSLDEQGRSIKRILQDRAVNGGYTETLHFLGPKTYAELSEILQQSWVVVNPSRYESFGMTTLEALACGAAVVVYDSIGIAEWLKMYNLGSVVKSGDIQHLAVEVSAVIRKLPPQLAGVLKDHFSAEQVARQQLDYYQKLEEL